MQSQELASLESRLLDPLPIPIIGQCLQKKAVTTLAEDRSPEAVKLLAKAVTRLKEPEIKANISDALGKLRNQNCINAVCEVWADTRHRDLANLLIKKNWVASARVELRVITALKANQPQVITIGGQEVVEPLLNAFKDRDSEIANRASECAVLLKNLEAQEKLCRLFIEKDHQIAGQVAIEAQYAPQEPNNRALFYLLTDQWDKYESFDFDQTLLQKAHELANEQLRKRIAAKLRKAGRIEWLKVIAGGDRPKKLGAMTDDEWETTLEILNNNQQWEAMWQLAQKAPAVWSKQLLQKFNQEEWLPTVQEERLSFKKLKQLAEKNREKFPSMGRLLNYKLIHTGHKGIEIMTFSPDGQILASSDYSDSDNENIIKLWLMPEGKNIATIISHASICRFDRGITFSPDGRILASYSADNTIILWQMPNGHPLATLTSHNGNIKKITFSPDSQVLAGYSNFDNTIILWQMPEGKHIATLTGHNIYGICHISFSPDGKILASCSQDGTTMLWQIPEGKHIATLTGHNGEFANGVFSPDGKLLASHDYEDKIIKLWQIPERKNIAILISHTDNTDEIKGITFSPDGQILASYCENEYHNVGDKTIRLWQMPNGHPLATLTGHNGNIKEITFSPDSQILASCSNYDKTIMLWQMPDGKHIATLTGHTEKIYHIGFSPDGKILASCSDGGTLRLWQMPNGFSLACLENYYRTGITFSPNGKILASNSSQGTIMLWSSDVVQLSRLPIQKLCQQNREFIQEALQNKKATEEERNWLEFIQALMDWHQRFDVEVEDAPQLVNTGEFDIEIDG